MGRHFQNIEIADGKISGTYITHAGLKLTAIYSVAEVKLYGQNIGRQRLSIFSKKTVEGPPYSKGWIEGVKKDTIVFLTRKALLEQ